MRPPNYEPSTSPYQSPGFPFFFIHFRFHSSSIYFLLTLNSVFPMSLFSPTLLATPTNLHVCNREVDYWRHCSEPRYCHKFTINILNLCNITLKAPCSGCFISSSILKHLTPPLHSSHPFSETFIKKIEAIRWKLPILPTTKSTNPPKWTSHLLFLYFKMNNHLWLLLRATEICSLYYLPCT